MGDSYVVLDIETVPGPAILATDPPEDWLVKGMGNRKDPAKVEAKRRENAGLWAQEAIKRGSIDWRHGEIVAIGYKVPNGAPEIFMGNEAQLLRAFWEWFAPSSVSRYPTVGFNLRQFDLPWIRGRSFVHGLRTPTCWLGGRYDTRQVVDWMDILSAYGAFSWAGWTLDAYVEAFCSGAPEAYGSGADVYGWFLEGDTDSLVRHLRADLLRTECLHLQAGPVFL